VRTTNDLLRMVPFALFIVIPFMEVMLPVALKLFPNMLPSTFQDKHKKEEEMRQRVKVKLEVAKFLQDCVEDKAKKLKKSRTGEAAERSRELYKLVARVSEPNTSDTRSMWCGVVSCRVWGRLGDFYVRICPWVSPASAREIYMPIGARYLSAHRPNDIQRALTLSILRCRCGRERRSATTSSRRWRICSATR
jgi:hypothetical protein